MYWANWFIPLRSFFTDYIIICSLIFKGWFTAFYFYRLPFSCSFFFFFPQKSLPCSVNRSWRHLVGWKQPFSHNVVYYYHNFLSLTIATASPEQAENWQCWKWWWGMEKMWFLPGANAVLPVAALLVLLALLLPLSFCLIGIDDVYCSLTNYPSTWHLLLLIAS